jgi:bacillaene synthase trans-acting acyltransferase
VTQTSGEQIFLFSGQGAQFYQMGRELYEGVPPFRKELERLDRTFQQLEGISLLDVIYGPKTVTDPMDDIRWSHPALFMLQHALATVLIDAGVRPDRLLGFSLGEYVARTVAGDFDVAVILRALIEQARILSATAPEGFMLSALDSVQVLRAQPEILKRAEVGALGSERITILVGKATDLPELMQVLRGLGIAISVLPVRVPFHSRWVAAAEQPWLAAVGPLVPQPRRIPIVGQEDADQSDQAPALWQIVRQAADFPSKLRRLNPGREIQFIDLGPSSTMSNWVRHTAPGRAHWTTRPVMVFPGTGDLARFEALFET